MAEYICREDVLDIIEDMRNNHFILMGERANLALLKSKVAEIPAADVQPVDRWISVDERLPEIGVSVLVAVIINSKVSLPFRTDFTPEIRIGWRDTLSSSHKWCLQFDTADRSKVTHWQPLPEPPTNKI